MEMSGPNIGLSGTWPPDLFDPCVCNAPLRSWYAISDTILPDGASTGIMIRVRKSNPCSVDDWVDLCQICDPGVILTTFEQIVGPFSPGAVAPVRPPSPLNESDTHVELHPDGVAYWTYTAQGWRVLWDGQQTAAEEPAVDTFGLLGTPGAVVTTQPLLDALAEVSHVPAVVTNTKAPYAWDAPTQTLNIPVQDTLTDDGKGMATFTPGDGSAPTIFKLGWTSAMPMPNGDIVLTYPDGTMTTIPAQTAATEAAVDTSGLLGAPGATVMTQPLLDALAAVSHVPAVVTNMAAPYAWDAATQALNIPVQDTLTAVGSTFTFTPGDGSAPTMFDGSDDQTAAEVPYTPTAPLSATTVQGALDQIAPQLHPAVALTNTAAPFSFNPITQAGNIPLAGTLVNNNDGSVTFTPGDGSAPVMVDICSLLAFCKLDGLGDVVAPAPVAGEVLSFNGTNWVPVNLPVENFLQSATYDAIANVLTLRLTDGTTFPVDLNDLVDLAQNAAAVPYTPTAPLSSGTVQGALDQIAPMLHPAVALTNTAAPFSFNPATQAGNIPMAGTMVKNSDGTATFTPGDGSAPTILPLGWTKLAQDPATKVVTITYPDGTTGTLDICNCPSGPALTGNFTLAPASGAAPLMVTFNDTSTGVNGCTPDSWLWDFGDGGTSTIQNPTHSYAAQGTYTVTLTVACSDGALTDTVVKAAAVTVTSGAKPAISPLFTANKTGGSPGEVVDFTDATTGFNGCTPDAWVWESSADAGATWVQFSTVQHPSNTFAAAGTYKTRLTATCSDGAQTGTYTLPTDIVISATPTLTANFTLNPASGAAPLSVTFADTSAGTGGCVPTSWLWDFGDGATSAVQHPTHVYSTAGTYTVTLTTTCAAGGLSDTEVKAAAVTVSLAPTIVADFSADNLAPVVNAPVQFTDLTVGANGCTPNAWLWNFGDTATSTVKNPSHAYAAPGTYAVTLTASCSDGGVNDSETKTAYITVTAASLTGLCYRDLNATATAWDFATMIPNNTARGEVNGAGRTVVVSDGDGGTVSVTMKNVENSTGAAGFGHSGTSDAPRLTLGVDQNQTVDFTLTFSKPLNLTVGMDTLREGEEVNITSDGIITYHHATEAGPSAVITGNGTSTMDFDADPAAGGANGNPGIAGDLTVIGATTLRFVYTSDDASNNDNLKLLFKALGTNIVYYNDPDSDGANLTRLSDNTTGHALNAAWELVDCALVP